MAGQYRALLIGNSTYPADEHNLQTLKGPVKDIAALNRALIDPAAGLFADVEVTLLPEATSTRAIRALGKFFGAADREDVLLVYFSGHGKLDQTGRLHLCMQDTESDDLLSTAVSSARIREFADASRARNVVVVLDCCYAGAFRGGDLPDAVAGPGRYVLTSCRGTQLANDANVDNGTSFFTQHLIDGLLGAAPGQDADGYVTFSDLYAYVDRRLREAGKQIPQRRVDGDGDVRLARRSLPPPGDVSAPAEPPRGHGGEASKGPPGPARAAGGRRPARVRRKVLLAAAAAVAVVVAGTAITFAVLPGGSGANPGASVNLGTSVGTYTASAPWRLKVEDHMEGGDNGCSIVLADAHGSRILQYDSLYSLSVFQIHQTGSFTWRVNRGCLVAPLPGSGTVQLPFAIDQSGDGDTPAFAAPARVAVHVKDYHGDSDCLFYLRDAADGRLLDFQTAKPGQDTVTLLSSGSRATYLDLSNCGVQVSAA